MFGNAQKEISVYFLFHSTLPKPGASVVSKPLFIYSKHLSFPELQCVIYRAHTVLLHEVNFNGQIKLGILHP